MTGWHNSPVGIGRCHAQRILEGLRPAVPLLAGLLALSSVDGAFAQVRWSQSDFVLGTFWDPPYDVRRQAFARDSVRFRLAKDAHFNLLTGMQDYDGVERSLAGNRYALRLCAAVGLRYLAADDRFFPAHRTPFDVQAATQLLHEYKALPVREREALYGYNLCDEPEFRGDQAVRLRAWKDFLAQGDSIKLSYYNLVGSYAASYRWGGFTSGDHDIDLDAEERAEYERYCMLYVDVLDPDIVSFDHYPFFADGTVRPDYFFNLNVIRRRAGRRPFWAYPMTVDHLVYADPDEAQLRFMYFCPIAYGARGLIVFTFWKPADREYREAIVDPEGRPTRKYAIISRLNLYVTRVLAPVVMEQPLLRVLHAGDYPGQAAVEPFRPSADNPVIALSDPRVLMGMFGGEGVQWLVVVNKALTRLAGVTISLRGEQFRAFISPPLAEFTDQTSLLYTPAELRRDAGETVSTLLLEPLEGGEARVYRIEASP